MKKFIAALSLIVSLVRADILFHKGTLAFGIGIGSGSITYDTAYESTRKNYFIFGLGADYFIVDNLSIGVSVWNWSGESPTVMQYTLPTTFYFDTGSKISPYTGIYYRYTDYMGLYSDRFGNSYSVDATHSLGVRIGFAYKVDFGYVGIGLAGEKDVDDGTTTSYPELSVGFVF